MVGMVFSLLASLVVALTLLPLLIYVVLQKKKGTILRNKEVRLVLWERLFDILFKHRIIVLLAVGGLFFTSLIMFFNLDRELFPKVDQHEFIAKIEAPPGTPFSGEYL